MSAVQDVVPVESNSGPWGNILGRKILNFSFKMAHPGLLYISERWWGPLNVVGPRVTYPLAHTVDGMHFW